MADPDVAPFDLIVFGATSFVGQILCRHLVERHGTSGTLRWAIAGRNATKLEHVAKETGAHVEQFVADASSEEDMRALADRANAVVSTVGPYGLYGSSLVAACAQQGTDYCDLTGEPHWMREMIDTHHEAAINSGARIVHACGFDSIPSDLGVAVAQAASMEQFGVPLSSIAMRVKAMKGGASGGTIASMMNALEDVRAEPELRSVLANPYALAPAGERSGVRQRNVVAPTKDDASGQWIAPFIMASVNTRVVHRSHALLGMPWGDDFRYDEAMLMGEGMAGIAKAGALTGGLGAFMAAAAVGPTRKLLNARVLPKPGEGPSPTEQANGFFDIRMYGATADGRRLTAKVTGDRDPGYGSTAKMLGETAVVLAGLPKTDVAGGFHTPSTAFGIALTEPLAEHAGMTFTILE